MAYFETTIETTADAVAAFRYLADFSNAASWDPGVSEAHRLDEGAIGAGARFRVDLALGPRSVPLHYTLDRFEPDHLLVFRSDDGWFRSLDTITIEPTATGSRIHYDADLRFEGLGFLLDPLVHVAFQVSGQRSADGLRRALDRLASGRDASRTAAESNETPRAAAKTSRTVNETSRTSSEEPRTSRAKPRTSGADAA